MGLKIIVVLYNFYAILSHRQTSVALRLSERTTKTAESELNFSILKGLNIHTMKYQKGMVRAQDTLD